jgi:hypothetical protein
MAAQSNVTISAVDARGLYTTVLDAGERSAGSALAERTTSQNHAASSALSEEVMAELVDGTGGTYFHNSNDLQGGFQALTAVPEYVYLLELSLQNVKQDGSYHPLKVKVDKEGLTLKARPGYFAPRAGKPKMGNRAFLIIRNCWEFSTCAASLCLLSQKAVANLCRREEDVATLHGNFRFSAAHRNPRRSENRSVLAGRFDLHQLYRSQQFVHRGSHAKGRVRHYVGATGTFAFGVLLDVCKLSAGVGLAGGSFQCELGIRRGILSLVRGYRGHRHGSRVFSAVCFAIAAGHRRVGGVSCVFKNHHFEFS